MKRSACLMVLMALSTPAYAGSYSFVIGGRHIQVEASRHCRSLSCVSWSETKKRDRDDAVAANATPAPAQTPVATAAPAPVAAPAAPVVAVAPPPVVNYPPPPPAPAPQIATAPVQTQPAPPPVVQPQAAPLKPVETRAAVVPAPAAPEPEAKPRVGFDLKPEAKLEPKVETKVETKPDTKPDTTATVAKAPAEKPPVPAVVAKPAPSKTTLQSEGDGIEAPIGDWQTEGRKGLVRIEPCGTSLCGYMINTSTNAKGETVLINMKPKAGSEWSGSIYSRASGNTYYGTMTMKRPNTLRVEACVVGHYFCSGNDWTRIAPKPDDVVAPRSTREASAEPPR
jgi:uncharacterized protein (DUF2147 family)